MEKGIQLIEFKWEVRMRIFQGFRARTTVVGLLATILGMGGCGSISDGGATMPADTAGNGTGSTTVSISGELQIPGFVETDSDVNDPLVSNESNNDPASAQELPNPVSVGGYLNMARNGARGNTFAQGDVHDYYKVDLKADQTLVLNIADATNADLDIEVFDESVLTDPGAVPVLRSADISKFESLLVPADGTYYIRVFAYGGASNYLLSIGLAPVSEIGSQFFGEDVDFVPGELLVKTHDSAAEGKLSMAALGVEKVENDSGLRLYRINENTQVTGFSASFSQLSDAQKKHATLLTAKKMRGKSGIQYVEPNYIRRPSAVPDDRLYSFQWHYPLINLPAAWDITTGDESVIVAVIDTGVLLNHPDLQGQLVNGYDFIRSVSNAGDGDGIDANPNDNGDGGFMSPSSFHGTHVAGTVAAASNNGEGVAGVAWNAKIMPLRVLGQQGGEDYDIAQAIRFAAGLQNDSGTVPTQRADIINLSLGSPQFSQTLGDAVAAARAAGVIVIAAAGNESTSVASYPAAYPEVVSVSAVDVGRVLAPYSNYGSTIAVAAPGGDSTADQNGDGQGDGVLSTIGDDSGGSTQFAYTFYQGTSMAAPHVAGVVALMKAVHPGLTPDQFDTALQSGAITTDIGSQGKDNLYGYGLIDAYDAVVEAQALSGGQGTTIPADVNPSPQSLNFGLVDSELLLYLDKVGTGDLAVSSVTADESWLTVEQAQVDALGFGSYKITVDRSVLEPAIYSATVTVVSSNNQEKQIGVIVQALDVGLGGNAGLQYVLMIKPGSNGTDEVVAQAQIQAQMGAATFAFEDQLPGEYYFVAGSDMDFDGLICDPGEACGAYPSKELSTLVNVTESISDLDFISTYTYESPASQSALGNVESQTGFPIERK